MDVRPGGSLQLTMFGPPEDRRRLDWDGEYERATEGWATFLDRLEERLTRPNGPERQISSAARISWSALSDT
jgi:hypothetical protein